MKKIKEKNIVVGDFIYIIDATNKKRIDNRRFILKILSKNIRGLWNIYFWNLEAGNKKTPNFNLLKNKGNYMMLEEDWERYDAYKLNKKEIEKFNRLLILEALE